MSADRAEPLPPAGAWPVLEQLGTGVALVDGDGAVRWANAAFAAAHGRSVDELVGTSVVDLHHGGSPYDDPGALAVAERPGMVYAFERDEGTGPRRYRLWMLPNDGAAGTAGATPAAAVPYVLEVVAWPALTTPRPGPLGEVLIDGSGIVIEANTAFATLSDHLPTLIPGRRFSDLVIARGADLPAALLDSRPGEERTFECRLARPDGRVLWVSIAVAARDDHDRRLLVVRDITDRRRDELLLVEVFDSSQMPYALVGPDGRVGSTNGAWRQRFGTAIGAGAALGDLFDDESRLELSLRLREVGGHGQPGFELPAVGSSGDGMAFVAHVRATALHDLSGHIERLLVSIDDVTEVALEVETARRNAQHVRSLVDELDLAVVVHDADGSVREVNLGAHRLFGAAATDLVGTDVVPTWWHPCGSDGAPLPAADHPVRQVLANRLPEAAATIGLTVSGGPRRWFRAHARLATASDGEGPERNGAGPQAAAPGEERDANGNPPGSAPGLGAEAAGAEGHGESHGVVASYVEVTDLDDQLRAARREWAELATAFEALPLATYEASASYALVRTNPAWQRLFSNDQAGEAGGGPGKGWGDGRGRRGRAAPPQPPRQAAVPPPTVGGDLFSVVPFDDRPALAAALAEAAATGDSVRLVHALGGPRPDGRPAPRRLVEHHIAPLGGPGGPVKGYVGTIVPLPSEGEPEATTPR